MEGLSQEVIFQLEEGVATVTLNRPDKRNALTTTMYENLRDILRETKRNDEIRVLLITGNGPGFCSGSDIQTRLLPRIAGGHSVPLEKKRSDLLEPVMLYMATALYDLGKPSIAAINGIAAGAGLSLALLCDIRLASERAEFVASWLNMGLTPDVGITFSLPRIIGADRALSMFFTGETIQASDAERINLVTRVIPHENLMSVAKSLAIKIAKGPSVAIELAKRAVHHGLVNDLLSQLYFENYAQSVCFTTEDFKEGVRAFQEKGRPTFRGF